MDSVVGTSVDRLLAYCKNQDWLGYDPFDGLNSRIFQKIGLFKNHKLPRLLFLQLNKKSPINLRPFFKIGKGINPKGLGLFLLAIIRIYKRNRDREDYELIGLLIEKLKENRSPGWSGYCWGYNFDWQSRAFYLPKGIPTAVNTSFIARAFLEAFEVTKNNEFLEICRSSCDFIMKDLNKLEGKDFVAFSYSPLDHYFVNNANALTAALLSSVYSKTGEEELARTAKQTIHYVVKNQQKNGSWNYGEDQTGIRVGIDNFHTGFILESLKIYTEATGDRDYIPIIKKGLFFYQDNFFLSNGAPKYFYNKSFPFDIHSASQAIITLLQLRNYGSDSSLCQRIVIWMIDELQDRSGYFYYQKGRYLTNKISYMRWSQAWALRALSEYLLSNA